MGTNPAAGREAERVPVLEATDDPRAEPGVPKTPTVDCVLTVLDDVSAAPLKVDIVEGRGIEWMPGTWRERRTILTDQRTPVCLSSVVSEATRSPGSGTATLRWWIGSRDHEWLMVDAASILDPQTGEDTALRLRRSGGVQLAVPIGPLPKSAVLRLRHATDRPPAMADEDWVNQCMRRPGISIGEFRPVAPSTWIERILPERYRVALEIGDVWYPLTLGDVEVDVVVGQIAAVELRMFASSATLPPKVRIAGTVRVPIAWRDATELRFSPRGAAEAWARDESGADDCGVSVALHEPFATSEQERTYRWDIGHRYTGAWEASVLGTGWSCRRDVRPGREQEYEFVVPPPSRVRVTLVDAVTGPARQKLPESESLPWSARGDDSTSSGSLRFEGKGVFVGDVPSGEVEFWPLQELTWAPQAWRLVPGENRITIVVHEAGGVRLQILDEDDTPWSGMDVRLVQADGQDATGWQSFDGDTTSVGARIDGAMTLVVPPFDGHLPIADRRVVVKYGEWTAVTIRLERARK